MGMDKSGAQTMVTTGYTKLTTFTVRSGYPATSIVNSTLVMDATGTGTLRYQANLTNASSFGQGTMRVVRNGTTVVDGPVTTGTVRTSGSISVVPGDTLELQVQAGSTFATAIVPGSANTGTWLEYNQVTSQQSVNGTASEVWGRSGTLAVQEVVAGTVTDTWGCAGTLSVTARADGNRTNDWGVVAGIYRGAFPAADGVVSVGWGVSGGILLIPKPTPLPSVFDVSDVSVSIHTVDGRRVGDFPCGVVNSFNWSREQNEVSVCSFDVATQGDPDLVDELLPWVHWATVWHGDAEVWTGPIQTVKITTASTTVSARDTATFAARTRVPISRTWVDTHPEEIAFDLWTAMLQLHRVRVTPTVLSEVVQKSFTITAKAQQRMLSQLMDDLTKVGLLWTVVAGRPVFGPFSRDPVATLQDCDFMVELERHRDGTKTFNDVRIQGQNWAQNAKADLAGLSLQTLVSLDDMFGSANIQRAALQYAQDSARIRDELVVPGNASLHPQAQVTLDDLVPGKTFVVHSGTASQLMRLDRMSVNGSDRGIDVQVGLVALEAKDEIAKLVGGGGSA